MEEFTKQEILGLIAAFPGVVFFLGRYFIGEYKKTKTALQRTEHSLHKKEIELENLKQNQALELQKQYTDSALNKMESHIDGVAASVRNSLGQFRKLESMNTQAQIKQQAAIAMFEDVVSQFRALNNSLDNKIRTIAKEEFKNQTLHLVTPE